MEHIIFDNKHSVSVSFGCIESVSKYMAYQRHKVPNALLIIYYDYE